MNTVADGDPIVRFWSEYASALAAEHITGTNAEWAQKHVEAYIRKTADTKLKDQVAEDLTHYMARWVHVSNPSSFVLEQKTAALRILFQKIVKAAWAEDYPSKPLGSPIK